ncbi:hypothetical protein FDECE_11861 [Fusarium decemcellulare]|nr:hypothetical protein FDECE_11861 [Fusarium decemcellulare]
MLFSSHCAQPPLGNNPETDAKNRQTICAAVPHLNSNRIFTLRMAEIFGAAAAAFGAVQQVSKFCERTRDAECCPKSLRQALEKRQGLLVEVMAMANLIETEEPFKTTKIGNALRNIQKTSKTLIEHLQDMCVSLEAQPPQSNDGKMGRLEELMEGLNRGKMSLGVGLESVTVGLTPLDGEVLSVNTATVENLNSQLGSRLEGKYSLKLAAIVKKRGANADGTVILTEADITELTGPTDELFEPNPDGTEPLNRTKRVIKDNQTFHKAFMQNVPVTGEEDYWGHINEIEISGNVAKGRSTMFNYPVSRDIILAGLRR